MVRPGGKLLVGGIVVVLLALNLVVVVRLSGRSLQTAVKPGESVSLPMLATPPDFTVAIIGDQGINENSQRVMELIRDEGADMTIVSGDLGYNESDQDAPVLWDAMVTEVLGADYPLFAAQGNHDVGQWSKYQSLLRARLTRIPEATCTGDLGIKSACLYRGLFFLLTLGGTDDAYYRDQLAASNSLWRICSWHKNQRAMHLSDRSDAIGWGPYEECRAGDAFVVTGHDHAYGRTKTLSNTQRQTVDLFWPEPDTLRVGSGSTFVVVSGLGGRSIHGQDRCLPGSYPYGCNDEWASIYTADQAAAYGALFVQFNVDGNEEKARGYFKNINGEIIDTFTVTADVGGTPAPAVEVLVSEGANWKYLDDGIDQGVVWREVDFIDSRWPAGAAQLGYGDGDEATVVSYGSEASNKHITTYFRHTFEVLDPGSVSVLSLALLSDDGGVVYLNGEEIMRRNMPAGGIDYHTFAPRSVVGAEENSFERTLVSPALLREGMNVLAVEVHQANLASSDISFDLSMDVVREAVTPTPTVLPSPTPSPSPSPSPTPIPDSVITSADISFENNQYHVKPGDEIEIPFSILVRGQGIADIIARAVFKIADITQVLRSFNPIFE